MKRARTVRRTMLRLYPVAAKGLQTPIFSQPTAETIRFLSSTQSSDGFTTVTKKRKFGTPGRPIGAVGKAKTIERDAETRSLSFIPQINVRRFGDSPTSTQRSIESEIEVELTPPNQ